MDPLDELLYAVRANGAVLGTPTLAANTALRFTDGAALTLCSPLRGDGWLLVEDQAVHLEPGDVAVVRGPQPFLFAGDPGSTADPTDVRCDGSVAETDDGRFARRQCTDDGTVLLAGAFHVKQEMPSRLLRALPPIAVVPEDPDCAPLRDYIEDRIAAGKLGRQVSLDRLVDWLLVCTLRDWFDLNSPRWYTALSDDVIGPVLQAMHRSPAAPWTLASLAGVANVSRTTLARRFTELTGESPLGYLTDLRMTLAADLLAEPGASVGAVARQIGYADAFSFSAAFKRERGISPSNVSQPAGV